MTLIVLFIRSLDVGGAERQLVALAKGLSARGVPVRVLTFYPGGTFLPELEAAGVPVEDLGKCGRWDVVPFVWRLYRRLRDLNPGVLYAWLTTANTLAAIIGRLAGVRRIVWGVRASNIDFDRYDWLTRVDFFFTRLTAQLADCIVCNSDAGRDFHITRDYPERKLIVVENGIDTEYFRFDPKGRARLRAEWQVGEHERLVGLVARLDPMKDHETFVRAAAVLARERNDVRFVCVGDGLQHYRLQLDEVVRGLGLQGRVQCVAARQDLAAVYSAMDVVSSSSYGEGFSNAIAEAMSCERPCVVTDVGDSARIVGETGRVVPARDPVALAKAWSAMLTLNVDSSSALGRRARQRILDNFSFLRMVEISLRVLQG